MPPKKQTNLEQRQKSVHGKSTQEKAPIKIQDIEHNLNEFIAKSLPKVFKLSDANSLASLKQLMRDIKTFKSGLDSFSFQNQAIQLYQSFVHYTYNVYLLKSLYNQSSSTQSINTQTNNTLKSFHHLKDNVNSLREAPFDFWQFMINNKATQQILIFMLFCHTFHNNELLDLSTYHHINNVLLRYASITKDQRRAIIFFYHQNTDNKPDTKHTFYHEYDRFLTQLDLDDYDIEDVEKQIKDCFCLRGELPFYIGLYINNLLFLKSINKILSKSHDKQKAGGLLNFYLTTINPTDNLAYSTDNGLLRLFTKVVDRASIEIDMNCFHNPGYLRNRSIHFSAIEHIFEYMETNQTNWRFSDKYKATLAKNYLPKLDQQLGNIKKAYGSLQSDQDGFLKQSSNIFQDQIEATINRVLPLMKEPAIIEFEQFSRASLSVLNGTKSINQLLLDTWEQQYRLPQINKHNKELLSKYLSHASQNWCQILNQLANKLIELNPPDADHGLEMLYLLTELITDIRDWHQALDYPGEDFNEALQQYSDIKHELAQQSFPDSIKNEAKPKSNKTNKKHRKNKNSPTQGGINHSGSFAKANDKTEQNTNKDTRSTSSSSSNEPQTDAAHSHPDLDYKKPITEPLSQSSSNELTQDTKTIRTKIPKSDLPEGLFRLQDIIKEYGHDYLASDVHLVLVGGAVLALSLDEPDKIRDYDCIANINIHELCHHLQHLNYNCEVRGDKHPILAIYYQNEDNESSNMSYYKIEISQAQQESSVTRAIEDSIKQADFGPASLSLDLFYYKTSDTLEVKGAPGVLETLQDNKITTLLPSNESIAERIQQDPVRLMRLVKLQLTFPYLEPNFGLKKSLYKLNFDPTSHDRLMQQANANTAPLGTAIEGLFTKFSTSHVINGLLCEGMPDIGSSPDNPKQINTCILSILTGIDKAQLQSIKEPMIQYIQQARESDSYAKKLRLFETLLTACYLFHPNKESDQCEHAFLYNIKDSDYKRMNFISLKLRGINKGKILLERSLHQAIQQIQEIADNLQNKQEKTKQYNVSSSTEFSQLGYFAGPSDTPELPENNGYESSDSAYPYQMSKP